MRKEKYLFLFLFVLLAGSLAANLFRESARGQEGPGGSPGEDVAGRVDEILADMGEDRDAVWRAGRRIEALGMGAAPHLLGVWPEISGRSRVAVGFALARLGHRVEVLEWALEGVRKGKNTEDRVLMADLLGIVANATDGEKIEKRLDAVFEPKVKIALCQALWKSARNLRAKKEMKLLLDSEDEDVRINAAMALAEIGDVEAGRTILSRLAEEPTLRGRLARSLLKEYDYKRMLERGQFNNTPAIEEVFRQKLLEEIRITIKENYVDTSKTAFSRLAEKAASGVAMKLDPYSTYIPQDVMERRARMLRGELVGVGIFLSIDPRRKEGEDIRRIPVVVAPLFNGPAEIASVSAGDELWEIDGESVIGKSLVELEGKIAGPPGSAVTLTLYHQGWFRERKVTLHRARTGCPTLLTETLPGGLLVLRAPILTLETGAALLEAMETPATKDVKGVILDLRNNASGSLEAAVDGAAAFLPENTAVYRSVGRNPDVIENRTFSTVSGGKTGLPLVVLVNGGTAFAAEILAGALKDHGRASLVGEETFGLGSIQRVFPLQATGKKTALKLTVGHVRLPESGAFQGSGLQPDRSVPLRRMEIWRQDEIYKVVKGGHVERYIEAHLEKHLDLFKTLAKGDGRDPGRYPDFDAWFKSTRTRAEKEDLRRLLRSGIRRRLAERLDDPFVTDLQEDEQLRCAVAVLARRIGLDLAEIPAYKSFAGKYD